MCAFDYPQIELASVEVDVPMYTKTDNKLDNMQQGHVTADVPDGFNEKVKDALQVFADTLQASFNEEGESNARTMRPTKKECGTTMTDLDDRISEYAKWIESRYDDSHELRAKGKNGYIDGKADAYESSLREFKRIFNVKEE